MPDFEFTSPEGKKYTVSGPSGATKEQAFGILQNQIKSGSAKPEIKSNADLIPGGGVSGSRNLGKEKEESLGEKLYGAGEAGLSALGSAATGIAAPFVGAGASMLGYQGKKGIQAQNAALDELNEQVYQPRTAPGQRYVSNIGNAIQNSGIGGLAGMNEMQTLGHMAPPAINQVVRPITSHIGEAVRTPIKLPYTDVNLGSIADAGSEAKRLVTAPISSVKNLTSDLTGSKIAPAQKIAEESARKTLSEAQREQNILSIGEQKHSEDMQSLRIALENNLKQHRENIPTTDNLGSGIRNLYNAAIDSAKKARESQADIDYPLVEQAAKNKEDQGFRVDVSPVLTPLKQLRSDAVGIKSIQGALDEIESAVKMPTKQKVSAPTTIGKSKFKIVVPPVQEDVVSGKTVKQLQLALRKLNDIAYNGKDQGFDSIVTNAAKKAANTLDEQIQKFVPEHSIAKENYARLSEPLDSLSTRLGKAITGTEGGLSKDAFSKIAAGTLPDKLFANPEGVSLLKEALAGGKNATPEAISQASKQVNELMEKWILSKESTSTAEQSLGKLKAPGMRSTLEQSPEVESAVNKKLESMAAIERQSAQLETQAKSAKLRSEQAAQAANRMKNDIENADILSKLPDAKSQSAALNGYMNTLAREKSAGLISSDKYAASMKLISDANTISEKSATARRIARRIAGLGTGIFVGTEASKIIGK